MSGWKIDEILTLLAEAGRCALTLGEYPAADCKPDGSAVTAADRAIERNFAERFDHPERGIFLIGEETDPGRTDADCAAALAADRCYVIDPIDGTAPYIADVPLWGISLGLLRRGVMAEGAIYLPPLDEAFLSCRGTLWHVTGAATPAPDVRPFETRRGNPSRLLPVGVGQTAAKRWQFEFPNPLFAWSSAVGSCRALLRGQMLAYLMNSRIWDLAGAVPLLAAAGFTIRFADGKELDRDVAHGGDFLLSGPDRWRLREHTVAAPDPETAQMIWNQVKADPNE